MTDLDFQQLVSIMARFNTLGLAGKYQLRLLLPAEDYDDAVTKDWIDKDNPIWVRCP